MKISNLLNWIKLNGFFFIEMCLYQKGFIFHVLAHHWLTSFYLLSGGGGAGDGEVLQGPRNGARQVPQRDPLRQGMRVFLLHLREIRSHCVRSLRENSSIPGAELLAALGPSGCHHDKFAASFPFCAVFLLQM